MSTEYFTPPQIEKLRAEFGKIERVSVDEGATIFKMAGYVKTLPAHLVKQLAEAKIKFLSTMADGELRDRKEKV